jgi:hypothetical protein
LRFADLKRHRCDVFLYRRLVKGVADKALDLIDRVFRVGDCLAARNKAHQALAGFETATTEGVVRAPSAFSRIWGSPPRMIAIAELVVPKSIPRIFAIKALNHEPRIFCLIF